ncbi:MAG: hypothetical protein ACLSAH_00260 [Bilophila wadsworthia]
MKRCVLALLALALCNLLFHGTAQAAPKQAASDAVRVAVLPFQINGGADLNYLNNELPKLFEQRLAQKDSRSFRQRIRCACSRTADQPAQSGDRALHRQAGRGELRRVRQLQQDRRRVQHRRPHGGCRWTAGAQPISPRSKT